MPWYCDAFYRIIGGGAHSAFDNAGPEQVSAAKKLVARVEAEGARHVKALRKHLKKKSDLRLSDKPWLGHLVSLREDFRGVQGVEQFLQDIGYEAAVKKQEKSVSKVFKAFYDRKKDAGKKLRAILQELPSAFLYEGFPAELRKKMGEWRKAQKKLSKADQKRWQQFQAWEKSWDEGMKQYKKIWSAWK